MLRHQLPNLCLLSISVILKNERADTQNTSMSWVLLNRVPKYSVPMSNTQTLFLSQIPKADVSHARWYCGSQPSITIDLLIFYLFRAYVLSFPSSVVFSDSLYSASRYQKFLNPGANFERFFIAASSAVYCNYENACSTLLALEPALRRIRKCAAFKQFILSSYQYHPKDGLINQIIIPPQHHHHQEVLNINQVN